jgi:hypothetical protein
VCVARHLPATRAVLSRKRIHQKARLKLFAVLHEPLGPAQHAAFVHDGHLLHFEVDVLAAQLEDLKHQSEIRFAVEDRPLVQSSGDDWFRRASAILSRKRQTDLVPPVKINRPRPDCAAFLKSGAIISFRMSTNTKSA